MSHEWLEIGGERARTNIDGARSHGPHWFRPGHTGERERSGLFVVPFCALYSFSEWLRRFPVGDENKQTILVSDITKYHIYCLVRRLNSWLHLVRHVDTHIRNRWCANNLNLQFNEARGCVFFKNLATTCKITPAVIPTTMVDGGGPKKSSALVMMFRNRNYSLILHLMTCTCNFHH